MLTLLWWDLIARAGWNVKIQHVVPGHADCHWHSREAILSALHASEGFCFRRQVLWFLLFPNYPQGSIGQSFVVWCLMFDDYICLFITENCNAYFSFQLFFRVLVTWPPPTTTTPFLVETFIFPILSSGDVADNEASFTQVQCIWW